jgi:HSP20 family molecular chaperone IbpA
LREVAERLQPLNERLEEVRGEIMDRLAAAGMHDGIRELNVEVFDEGDEVVAIVELPGFAESDISVTVDEREVTVDGVKSGRHFSGSASLPDEVMAGWAVTTRNGLVEIRFRKRKEDGS